MATQLEMGTILWCKFPEWPRTTPGPKSRPVLVWDVSADGKKIRVIYGTSQNVNSLYAGEFAIRRQHNLKAFLFSGLRLDTKFNLNEMLELPWNAEFFPETVPIGYIDQSLYPSIAAAYRAIREQAREGGCYGN